MPVGTLLSPGCDTCFTCEDPPPPQSCFCFPADHYGYTPGSPQFFIYATGTPPFTTPCNLGPGGWNVVAALSLEAETACRAIAFTGGSQFSTFTDGNGVKWYPDGSFWYYGGVTYVPNPSSTDPMLVEQFHNTLWLTAVQLYRDVQNPFADPSVTVNGAATVQAYDTEQCACVGAFNLASGDWTRKFSVGFNFGSPTTCIDEWTDIDFVSVESCSTTCAANCCDGLKAGSPNITSVNKWSIGVAGGTACFPLAIPWVTTLSESPACTFQSTYAVGGGACFTDGAGGNWFVLQMKLVITSTNTAGPRPCTTATFTITYERVSDGTLADQIYNYDYDYCTYTTGALSLSSTSHTFPNGAPVFPSVTVTALA